MYLKLNTRFNPFTYDELVKPLADYGRAYKEVEEAYSTLSEQAEAFRNEVNQHKNSEAYQTHSRYSDELNAIMEDFSQGMTGANRAKLLDMKRRYNTEILPIAKAAIIRNALAEEQRKADLNNPTMIWERRAKDMSLDDFIKNPNVGYGKSYSGALLTSQVSEMVKNLTISDILPIQESIIEAAVDSSGMKEWATPEDLRRAYLYAKEGLWKVKQPPKPSQSSQSSKSSQQSPVLVQGKGFALNPSNIYSVRERDEEEKKYGNNIKSFSKYFYKENGKWKMNHAGWQAYNDKQEYTTGEPLLTPEGTVILTSVGTVYYDSPFKQFMDSLGMKNMSSTQFGPWQRSTAGNLWGNYVDNEPASKTFHYDAMKTSEYIFDVNQSPEYQKDYKAKLSRALGSDEQLTEVEYDPKTNAWVNVGSLSFSDLDTDDYNIVARAPSDIGTTLFIKKKGEKAKRYLALPGINKTAEDARDETALTMLEVRRNLLNPNLTELQRGKLERYYDDLAQQLYMFESQIDLTNSTKKQEFPTYNIP